MRIFTDRLKESVLNQAKHRKRKLLDWAENEANVFISALEETKSKVLTKLLSKSLGSIIKNEAKLAN